uniref:CSON008720 protein n=1 Tax=Culicoides sonorensis TaxID=179676 RepID=A0A336LZS9_CULSO
MDLNSSSSDGNKIELKKMPIKFSSNPKVLNMCQQNAGGGANKIVGSSKQIILSPTPQTSKNITVTSSLLKKLPGNISISTQKVMIPSQQASLIPNKPVVVQPVNPVNVSVSSTPNPTSNSSVCVSTARKIVFNPADSRFLKIVGPSEDTQATVSSGPIPANKKVIVQRVEQIQPAQLKKVVVENLPSQMPAVSQNKVIVVPANPQQVPIITKQFIKTKDESYIVNEMPPEMRTKAIIVSRNNPTGDSTQSQQSNLKVHVLPVNKAVGQSELTSQNKVDARKIAPVTITKKFLPIRPKNVPQYSPAPRIVVSESSLIPKSSVGLVSDNLKKTIGQSTLTMVPKQIPNISSEAHEMKAISEKIAEPPKNIENPENIQSHTQNPDKSNDETSKPIKNISLENFDDPNSINIDITDGQLSKLDGPIQMLDMNLKQRTPKKTSSDHETIDLTKSPRMQGRSKSAVVEPIAAKRRSKSISKNIVRSPSLSSILPDFTKQSKKIIEEIEKNESLEETLLEKSRETPENSMNNLLCDENMDNVSGSTETSTAEKLDADKENSESNKNGNEIDGFEQIKKFKISKENSTDNKSDENSDVEICGFPEADDQLTPPASPVSTVGRKRRRNSDEESEIGVPNVLKVPVHKLFKVQSGRINDDISLSDPFRHIKWNDGIGSLKNSTIHFKVNELGVYELMTNDEYYRLMKHKPDANLTDPIAKRQNRKRKVGKTQLYKCMVCNGTGTADEFRTPTICSWTCDETMKKTIKIEDDDDSTTPLTDLDDASQHDSPLSFTGDTKPKEEVKEFDAPSELFKNPFPSEQNNFQISMKLEAIDPFNQSKICVCTVEEKRGSRLKLRFDGYSSDYNFWVNSDSNYIFPPGWCAATGRKIEPPYNYSGSKFDWNNYLKDPKVMAPVQIFPHLKVNEGHADQFQIGMKLEVDCPLTVNLTGTTPGTILDIIGKRILIHLDFFDNQYDFWTRVDSPKIHKINWHKESGVKLHTETEKEFDWTSYLIKTRSKPVPSEAFKPRDLIKFEIGMRLEVVDPKNPGLVRPAVVKQVEGHIIRILFENWPEFYSFWVDDDDPNIHPPNWAKHTKHPLEHHKLCSKSKSKNETCPVIKFCRNIGNFIYKSRNAHKAIDECPYFPKNWRKSEMSDRLDYKKKVPSLPLPNKSTKLPTNNKQPLKSNGVKRLKQFKPMPKPLPQKTSNGDIKIEVIDSKSDEPFEPLTIVTQPLKKDDQVKLGSELLKINSKTLPNPDVLPIFWTPQQVADYIKAIPACEIIAELFHLQEIDGSALLSLTKDDLIHQLKIKFGPSVKIYNCILKLREQILSKITD